MMCFQILRHYIIYSYFYFAHYNKNIVNNNNIYLYMIYYKMKQCFYLLCYIGIRYHFPSLMKGFAPKLEGIAQLGLGHSYSRAKVKFNVNKVDNMIIHSVSLLDQLDKDLNTYSMRIR